jgi:diguanylate cyclase (GGDEF)-like protein/PAS domain S-box-containing protein
VDATTYTVPHRKSARKPPRTTAPRRNSAAASFDWLGFHPAIRPEPSPLQLQRVFNRLSSDDPVQRRAILEAMPQMAWSAAADGTVDFYNARVREFTGLSDGPGPKDAWQTLIHPDDVSHTIEGWKVSVQSGEDYEVECRFGHRSAGYRWILCRAAPILGDDGSILYWIGSLSDIHDRKLAEEALKATAALTRSILEASSDITILLDGSGKLMFVNNAAERAAEVSRPTGADMHWRTFIPEPVHEPVAAAIEKALEGEQSRFCVKEPTSDGKCRWSDVIATPILDESGICRQVLLIARDVTETHLQTERIKWAASHDSLTGLANRHSFNVALERLASDPKRHRASLFTLDIDGFKLINDTHGHDAGDALLKIFARRLKAAVRGDDVVARLGGDEFAVILSNVEKEVDAVRAADEIIAKLRRPCRHQSRTLDCRASLGAALFPRDGITPDRLLKSADIALYTSKAAGRGLPVVYRATMEMEPRRHAETVALARKLLREDRIMAYYQPKVSLATGKVAGFEALLRWRDIDGTLRGAQQLAAAFDEPTLSCEIGEVMQRLVMADMRRWLSQGMTFGEIAINVTDAELRDGSYHERLLERLAAHRLPPAAIKIEVTERVLLGKGAKTVERTLRELDKAGIPLALDDFGTGYASLSHLQLIPVQEIKIDASFVSDLREANSIAITRALLTLGKTLGIQVVAEGVESASQADFLRREGCEFAQGFLFAEALPAAEAEKFLRRTRQKSALARAA